MSTTFLFKSESQERIYSRQVKPMVIFAAVLDLDNNNSVLINLNTCLIANAEENKVIPYITPKGTLEQQEKSMQTLKDTKVLLTLNWRGLYVLDREPDYTKESHRLNAVVVSINQFTMKVKETSGACCYTIPLNGIDFIETVSAAAAEDAVTL